MSEYLRRRRSSTDQPVWDFMSGKLYPLSQELSPQERQRQSITYPIQRIGAIQIKSALMATDNVLPEYDGGVVMALHDELVFDLPDRALQEAIPRLIRIMEAVLPLTVPGGPDIPSFCHATVGRNWGEQDDFQAAVAETEAPPRMYSM